MKSAVRKLASPVLLFVGWILYGVATNSASGLNEDPTAKSGIPLGDMYFVALGVVGLLVIVLYVALSAVSTGLQRESIAKRLLTAAATLPIAVVAAFSAFIMFGYIQQNIASTLSVAAFVGSFITALHSWFLIARSPTAI